MTDDTDITAAEQPAETPPPAPAGWECTTEDAAAWAIDRVLSQRARLDRVSLAAAAAVAREEAELARREEFFGAHLAAYYTAHPPARGKTIHTLAGSIGLRLRRGGVRVVDPALTLPWAEQHLPEAVRVRTTTSVVVDEVRSYVLALPPGTDLPPGVAVVDDEDRLVIEAPKGAAGGAR